MPVAKPYVIPVVCELLMKTDINEIKRILDIGSGFGTWGFLAREYIQVYDKNITRERYKNLKEELVIDSIEIEPFYNQEIQRAIYNNFYTGNAVDVIDDVGEYDIIIMGDVLEHLDYKDGLKLLEKCRKKAVFVIITMPDYWNEGRAVMDNEHEKHKYVWTDIDFPDEPTIKYINNQQVIIYAN